MGRPPAACAAERYSLPKGGDALHFQSESAVGGVRLTAGTACPLNVFGWIGNQPNTSRTRADGSSPYGLPPYAHVAGM